ncbi:MAG: hypothetical protein K2M16_02605, partial [Muribaculaceae bacterium]|nr:hypothetical protein [Muribaculaceae bacterium]
MKFRLFFYSAVAMVLLAFGCSFNADATNPKREFRGAWLHIIGQTQYMNTQQKGTAQLKAYIADQIDRLHRAGCNAVIFQVRPCADAAYISDIE